jgi:ABC-type sugar transport system ATPase subunit
LYLDEWTESLDDNAAQRLIGLVRRCQREGSTVIFVSHNFGIIKELADDLVMILGGQIFLKLTRKQIQDDEDLMRYVQRGMGA